MSDEAEPRRGAPRWGSALAGSGHFFAETLALIPGLGEVKLFVAVEALGEPEAALAARSRALRG